MNDPSANRLISIAHDAKIKGGLPAWTTRFHGDQDIYKSANP